MIVLKKESPNPVYCITDKSVSFEKSVSFSDEPPDMNSPKQHSPQHGGKSHLLFQLPEMKDKSPPLSEADAAESKENSN